MPIIQGEILEEIMIHTGEWKAYDGLILNGYAPYRVHHSKDEFIRGSHTLMELSISGLLQKALNAI